MDFQTALQKGRRELYALPFALCPRPHRRLLSLNDILIKIKNSSSSYRGSAIVPVRLIVGTEDRSSDFSASFYPVKAFMDKRWSKVAQILDAGEMKESVKLIEIGGVYFTRDGNHRTSVGRCNGVEFYDAEVNSIDFPIKISPLINLSRLPDLFAKYDFCQSTCAFDEIAEEDWGEAEAKTWRRLEWFIKEGFVRADRQMRQGLAEREIVSAIFNEILVPLFSVIDSEGLITLFPGKTQLDIAVNFINAIDKTDKSVAPTQIIKEQVRRQIQMRPLDIPVRKTIALYNQYRRSEAEERAVFYRITAIDRHLPQADILDGDAKYYRHLLREITELPYKGGDGFGDRIRHWYSTMYEPVYTIYRESRYASDGWSSVYKKISDLRHMQGYKKMVRQSTIRQMIDKENALED